MTAPATALDDGWAWTRIPAVVRWTRDSNSVAANSDVVSANVQNAHPVLEHQSAQYLSGNLSDRLQNQITPSLSSLSSPQQSGGETDVPQLEQIPQSLKERLHSAMRRRIGPGTGLTVKMVARATGLTDRTIENAMSGSSIPRSDTLHTLLCFFDTSFCNEVFAGANFMIVKLSNQRAADAARQINEGAKVLAQMQRGE